MPRSPQKRFAIGLILDGRIVSIPHRHITIEQAEVFQRVHNRLSPGKPVVIVSHPISRAISLARPNAAASKPRGRSRVKV